LNTCATGADLSANRSAIEAANSPAVSRRKTRGPGLAASEVVQSFGSGSAVGATSVAPPGAVAPLPVLPVPGACPPALAPPCDGPFPLPSRWGMSSIFARGGVCASRAAKSFETVLLELYTPFRSQAMPCRQRSR
jgi:hypothetical protein